MAEFESILRSVLSPQRGLRETGEKELQKLLQNATQLVLERLIALITVNDPDLPTLACVLIRKKFAEEGYLKGVSSQGAAEAKQKILQLVNPVLGIGLLKKIGDVLLNLAVIQNWEVEFLGYLASWSRSESLVLQELSLYLFEAATYFDTVLRVLEAGLSSLESIVMEKLNSSEANISTAASAMLFAVMIAIKENQLCHFGVAFQKAIQSASCGSEAIVLCRLVELTEKYPRIWMDKLQDLLKLVGPIAKNIKAKIEVRTSATEILTCLVRYGPVIVKNVYFLQEATTLGFLLLAEPEKVLDFEGWAGEITECYEEGAFTAGLDLLKALSKIKECGEYIQNMIRAHFESAHWVHINAAVTALRLVKNVEISILNKYLNSTPRIQWSLLKTLGVLCMENPIQLDEHSMIVQIILALTGHSCNKIVNEALNTLCLYITSLIRDETPIEATIFLYLDQLTATLFTTLGNTLLLAPALSALSLLITYTGQHFLKHTNNFLPGLRVIVANRCETVNDQNVRAEAVRCIGCLVETMGSIPGTSDIFLEVWKVKSESNEEDPVVNAVWDVLPQFAVRMGNEFLKYFDTVFAELITRIEADIDIHVTEALEAMPGYDQITISIQGLGDRTIAMNTMKLQSKITAGQTLYNLLQVLGPAFEPWLFRAITSISSLINFPYNSTLRTYMLKSIALTPKISNNDQLLIVILPKFLESLQKHTRLKPVDLLNTTKYLLKFFEGFSNVTAIGLSNSQSLSQVLVDILRQTLIKKAQKNEQISSLNPDLYKKEVSELRKLVEIYDEIMRQVTEVIACLLRSFNKKFQPIFVGYFQNILGEIFFKESSSDSEILAALCLFVDYIEFTDDLMCQGPSCPLLEQFIKCCFHKNENIRQTASYGIGVCSEKSPDVFSAYVQPSVDALKFILSLPCCRDTLLLSSESAAGALGKIALKYQTDLIPLYLEWLPFQSDPKEAQDTHSFFLQNLNAFSQYSAQTFSIISKLKSAASIYLNEPSQLALTRLS